MEYVDVMVYTEDGTPYMTRVRNFKGDQVCRVCGQKSFSTKKTNIFHGICPHCKTKGRLENTTA